MRRRLPNVLTAASLLLCVAVVALWVRSDRAAQEYWYSTGSTWAIGVGRTDDSFYAYHVSGWPYRLAPGVGRKRGRSAFDSGFLQSRQTDLREYAGFGYARSARTTSDFRLRLVLVPPWFPCAATAAAPAAWAIGRLASAQRRRGRLNRGQCPGCGYDMRATPGTCPECGTAPTGTSA